MGMFDYVKCEYPLPGGPVPQEILDRHPFQTKDTDAQYMDTYTITEDGRLLDKGGAEQPFAGELNFYTSNIVAGGYGQSFTSDGEDAQSFDFTAIFVDGRVRSITEGERTREVALSSREMGLWTPPTEDEKKAWKARRAESLIGKTLCVWYGGDTSKPYDVRVIAENERELSVQKSDGRFEILDRGSRDNTFFDSYDDAKRHKDERENEWKDKTVELAAKLEAKKSARTP